MRVDLSLDEITTLLWHLRVVDHAYGHEHSYLGAAASAEAKLERALKDEMKRALREKGEG